MDSEGWRVIDFEKLAGLATVCLAISTGLMAVRRYAVDRALLTDKLTRLESNLQATNGAVNKACNALSMLNAKVENLVGQLRVISDLIGDSKR